MKIKKLALFLKTILAIWLMNVSISFAAPSFTLQQVIDVAFSGHPSIRVVKAQEAAALATVTSANAFINPEIEIGAGPSRYRFGNSETRNNWGVALSQPLEFADVRTARREIAEANVRFAGVNAEINQVELRTRLKKAFYDVLQRQEALRLVEDDRNLLKQIRERVKLRVDIGESPKYELIKSDTEALAAERDYQAAFVRIIEAKSYLQGLVGTGMSADYSST